MSFCFTTSLLCM